MARILIIEDNPGNLELMTYLLGAFGHSTVVAINGEQGIEMAREHHPDLILCDIHLPGVDGYTVARNLKGDACLSGTPIVAVSALVMVGDREKGLAAGFDGYIPKPIDPQDFVAQVDGFLHAEQRGVAPPQQGISDTASASPSSSTRSPHKARVVFLDDSPTNCELIYQTLSPSGYEVIVAENVQQALELVKTKMPDLILSDLHMPGEDGFEFVRQIKLDPRLAAIPFVFLSSSIWGEHDREKAQQLGVTRFLVRPIEPQRLLSEVAAALGEQTAT
ncbi:MAG: response regulator [Rudaea sp.]